MQRIVFATGWRERLDSLTRLAPPDLLAGIVARGMSAGLSQRDIAKQILPHVEGVRSSARRVARTEGVRVAHAAQMHAYEKLGGLVIGYQIHATLDQHTRPFHAARNGMIYYKQPAEGQKGLHQMPRPPQEADDPAERPPGAPHTASNCRCYLTPVLSPPSHGMALPSGPVTPDPWTYSEWFERASPRLRRLAVGSRRYDAVHARTNRVPASWEAFIDPRTGALLDALALKAETGVDRRERMKAARELVRRRGEQLRRVAAQGHL